MPASVFFAHNLYGDKESILACFHSSPCMLQAAINEQRTTFAEKRVGYDLLIRKGCETMNFILNKEWTR
jgi:hypothetical protein